MGFYFRRLKGILWHLQSSTEAFAKDNKRSAADNVPKSVLAMFGRQNAACRAPCFDNIAILSVILDNKAVLVSRSATVGKRVGIIRRIVGILVCSTSYGNPL